MIKVDVRVILFHLIAVVLSVMICNDSFCGFTEADVDSATREVNRPFRQEAEESLGVVPNKNIIIEEDTDINLIEVSDGEYIGQHLDYRGAKMVVEVDVKDHRIRNIKVFGRDDVYVDMAKGVVREVIKHQSIKVDTVTGATVSSQSILKAIKNALTGN